ncbi:uncharacterized protein MONOS_3934 [Monocercomonoides exilis]|uniref:uncharacterized protein n=1 Tax=Monocercomonoides exilis TaxID=2049356 RepID=UPI003559F85E|nr:hypothetical protein MONOS_3934 [Monocercomonoides exilis]|eukprot:MONOS_3934.1-p1 / transcript=MONOS_3934.1 / gene=MONOS_3934 / organism=Monocercomonoides_exilis_PA203 / gene_product=unspecified product / transcript_product=unspecified product / location=Mono_scaffold00098:36474-37191(-) / protein_length=206 / sequence_SO=supercontig / SO=protein_coding / is_pseudo=false
MKRNSKGSVFEEEEVKAFTGEKGSTEIGGDEDAAELANAAEPLEKSEEAIGEEAGTANAVEIVEIVVVAAAAAIPLFLSPSKHNTLPLPFPAPLSSSPITHPELPVCFSIKNGTVLNDCKKNSQTQYCLAKCSSSHFLPAPLQQPTIPPPPFCPARTHSSAPSTPSASPFLLIRLTPLQPRSLASLAAPMAGGKWNEADEVSKNT